MMELHSLVDRSNFSLHNDLHIALEMATKAMVFAATQMLPTERQQALNANAALVCASERTMAWLADDGRLPVGDSNCWERGLGGPLDGPELRTSMPPPQEPHETQEQDRSPASVATPVRPSPTHPVRVGSTTPGPCMYCIVCRAPVCVAPLSWPGAVAMRPVCLPACLPACLPVSHAHGGSAIRSGELRPQSCQRQRQPQALCLHPQPTMGQLAFAEATGLPGRLNCCKLAHGAIGSSYTST